MGEGRVGRTASSLREVEALDREFEGMALCRVLLVARAVLGGALADRRSRGCHHRFDAEEAAVADLPG